jgi:hypothetical protein
MSRQLERNVERIREALETRFGNLVQDVLEEIAMKLGDKNFNRQWDYGFNNCQLWVEKILDTKKLRQFLNQDMYTFSFVCRPGAHLYYQEDSPWTPYGLSEEYIFGFRDGFHDEDDIFDALQTYWYDFAAFPSPLYQHHDLVPWDCTEAKVDTKHKCGNCRLLRHLWSFPFDSWSILQLHLLKDRGQYGLPESSGDTWLGKPE